MTERRRCWNCWNFTTYCSCPTLEEMSRYQHPSLTPTESVLSPGDRAKLFQHYIDRGLFQLEAHVNAH